ncbi:spidroin-1-like [Stomoxys calcitrans]|uniref:spidroin-1-like n=1 Tax=Stomoxys calcitrans TaxID=35570 RepID=UPI0027E2268E|nr:spidroin-1-like [Stomoxys calcitrans]
MRAFIVLCLVAVACADKLGYNYQPVGHSDNGLSFTPGAAGSSGGFGGQAAGGFGGQSAGGPAASGPAAGGTAAGGFGGQSLGGAANDAPSNFAPSAEFEKEFITYSASEGDFEDPNAAEQIANNLKQALRVVFIKGPENKGLEDAALALAKQASAQQTAIYVLNKQTDIGDLANKLNAINSASSTKPEVHFVKYRTAEDAANAQRTIQSQYDSLGGNSQNVNGGVAPVINFASQAQVRSAAPHTPQNSYLPSSVLRFRA